MAYKGGRLPGAVWDPISGRSSLSNKPVRMTIHIAVAHSKDIYGPSKGPGGTYAHFYNPKVGKIRQHQEMHRRTYADLEGNGSTVSVEHQGWPGDRLTASQIDNLAQLFATLVKHYGVPNRIATWNDTRGLAWHRLGCQGNFGPFNRNNRKTWSTAQTGVKWSTAFGKTCPTDNYIEQVQAVYDQAQKYIKGAVPMETKKPAKKSNKPKKPQGQRKGKVLFGTLLVDGDFGPVTTKALQLLMQHEGTYLGRIDGDFGPMSKKALQTKLKRGGWYKGLIDGWVGPMTIKALQRRLKKGGFKPGRIDGIWGPVTTRALQRYLNSERVVA